MTNCSLVRQVAVLQLPEDQSGYVDSILSRRARLLGLMWDLDKTPLRVLYAQCAGFGGSVCTRPGGGCWLAAGCAAGG